MPRYIVSFTLFASVTLDCPDHDDAKLEARSFIENCGPQDGFIDGWNAANAVAGEKARIVDFSGISIENVDDDDV